MVIVEDILAKADLELGRVGGGGGRFSFQFNFGTIVKEAVEISPNTAK